MTQAEICRAYLEYYEDQQRVRSQEAFAKAAYSSGWHDNTPNGGSAMVWTRLFWSNVEKYYRVK